MDFAEWAKRAFEALPSLENTIAGLAIIATIAGTFFTQLFARYQRKRLTNEEEAHRETHNLSLFRALSSSNPRLQLAAAAVLVERLKRLSKEPKLSDFQESEKVAIIRALVSVTKVGAAPSDEPEPGRAGHSIGIGKFVADSVAEILDAEWTTREKRKTLTRNKSPLQPYDWQSVRLHYAWWAGVDAREIDFFRADLSHSGMKLAHLQNAQLREAILCGTKLEGADLSGANLTEADITDTNFKKANLSGAILTGVKNFSTASFENAKYDKTTILPEDSSFAAKLAQMINVA